MEKRVPWRIDETFSNGRRDIKKRYTVVAWESSNVSTEDKGNGKGTDYRKAQKQWKRCGELERF